MLLLIGIVTLSSESLEDIKPLSLISAISQRKQAKLQWLQDPSEINGDKMNNARHEANIHFRNRKREYLKGKINEIILYICILSHIVISLSLFLAVFVRR
jgi:hypothetical protein